MRKFGTWQGFFYILKLVWDGGKWEPCSFSLSFLSFGLKGGLEERKVG
jgi:hypothetical protein